MSSSLRPTHTRALLRVLVLTAALGASVLPGATASAEEAVGTTVTGELVQAWAEEAHTGAAHVDEAEAPQSWIETAAGDAVPVETEDVADLPLGATVSVTVAPADDDVAAADAVHQVVASTVVAEATAPPVVPARRFTNEVTVALVAPAGSAPDGTTPAQVVDLVQGDVAAFWSEQTDGAVRIGVTATHDWLTTTADCSSAAALWNEVAARTGFTAGAGKHLLVYLPSTLSTCEYALAEVGRSTTSGGRLYVRHTGASIIAHELGHNFGLGHSSGRQCDGAVDAGSCRTSPYRDFYDVMGVSWSQLGSLNVAQAAQLKVLPPGHQQSMSVSGPEATMTLAPLSGRTGTRALRLTDAAGVDYWLEYRTATGRDAWLGSAGNRYGLDSGVLVRRAGPFPDSSLLLDGTPVAAGGWDADLQSALPVGVPVSLSGGQFSVVVAGVSPDGAVVHVVPTPPATAPSPAPAPAAPGAGQILPGQAAPAAAAAAVAPAVAPAPPAVPGSEAASPAAASPAIEAAADTSTEGWSVLVAAGALLAAALLVVVSRARRFALRSR